jgi:hypothetical protein
LIEDSSYFVYPVRAEIGARGCSRDNTTLAGTAGLSTFCSESAVKMIDCPGSEATSAGAAATIRSRPASHKVDSETAAAIKPTMG